MLKIEDISQLQEIARIFGDETRNVVKTSGTISLSLFAPMDTGKTTFIRNAFPVFDTSLAYNGKVQLLAEAEGEGVRYRHFDLGLPCLHWFYQDREPAAAPESGHCSIYEHPKAAQLIASDIVIFMGMENWSTENYFNDLLHIAANDPLSLPYGKTACKGRSVANVLLKKAISCFQRRTKPRKAVTDIVPFITQMAAIAHGGKVVNGDARYLSVMAYSKTPEVQKAVNQFHAATSPFQCKTHACEHPHLA